MQQLSFLDNGMLLAESARTPNHLCMVQIYDPSTRPSGRLTYEEVLTSIRENLPAAPSFRRKLVRVPLSLDNPYWVEDADFDLEFHVHQLALPAPGDWRQFRIQVARLHSRALDLSRPPWELIMISRLDAIEGIPKGSVAVMIKIHHAAIDGVSGVELLSAIHDVSPTDDSPPPEDHWRSEPTPSPWDLVRRAGVHALTRPLATTRHLAVNSGPIMRGLPKTLGGMQSNIRIPRTRFNDRVSAHRVFDDVLLPLQDMKQMKRTVPGATINDVCLSVVGGSMRRYLEAHGELPADPLIAMVPISLRTPDQVSSGGNQVSMMRTSLHTDIVDPVARLAAVHESTKALKAAQEGLSAETLMHLGEVVPGALVGIAMRAVSAVARGGPMVANTAITNVPGSPHPLYFEGAEMVRTTGCVPLSHGLGLFHCVSSYVDTFTFMYTACREMLPDPDFYTSCLHEAIDELRQVSPPGGTAPAEPAPARKPARKAAAPKAAAQKAPATTAPARKAAARKAATGSAASTARATGKAAPVTKAATRGPTAARQAAARERRAAQRVSGDGATRPPGRR